MTEERKPFRVRCQPCGHVWVAGYYPMELVKFANLLKGTKCPNCAADSKTMFLAQEDTPKKPRATSQRLTPRESDTLRVIAALADGADIVSSGIRDLGTRIGKSHGEARAIMIALERKKCLERVGQDLQSRRGIWRLTNRARDMLASSDGLAEANAS